MQSLKVDAQSATQPTVLLFTVTRSTLCKYIFVLVDVDDCRFQTFEFLGITFGQALSSLHRSAVSLQNYGLPQWLSCVCGLTETYQLFRHIILNFPGINIKSVIFLDRENRSSLF